MGYHRTVHGSIDAQSVSVRSERRSSERAKAVYRLVKVEYGDDEGVARCRNISDGGMRLDLNMPLAVGDYVNIVFVPAVELRARVIWADSGHCGVAFERKIDSAALLEQTGHLSPLDRAVRLRTRLPAQVMADGKVCPTVVTHVSLYGLIVMHGGLLRADCDVLVALGFTRRISAVVRWSKGNLAGLLLLEPFCVEELGSIRAFESAIGAHGYAPPPRIAQIPQIIE